MFEQTHVVSDSESGFQCRFHISMFNGHEDGVDDDAYGDEEINECIHNEQFNNVSKPVPLWVAFPIK